MIIKQGEIRQALKVGCDEEGIKEALRVFSSGGVVVFPTDTVYGMGCDPYNRDAVKKIYEIKAREASKQLPVLAYSKEVAEKIAAFDTLSERIAEKFWPGQLTMVLELTDGRLRDSLGLNDRIAIRVPDHRCTLELLRGCDFLVGTSANVSGRHSFTDPVECFKNLQDCDVFVDGGTIAGKSESTIIQVRDGTVEILRKGGISREELEL